MSAAYHVAVPKADWPTLAALEECIAQRGYPITFEGFQPEEAEKPFKPLPESLGLRLRVEDTSVELEFSLVKLSPAQPYAYQISKSTNGKESEGSASKVTDALDSIVHKHNFEKYTVYGDSDFTACNINNDLIDIGAKDLRLNYDDYVMTLNIAFSNDLELAGAFYIMSAMIYCFNGYGFEFQGRLHGRANYADELITGATYLLTEKVSR